LLGYRLTERLRHGLENLSLGSLDKAPAPRIYVLSQAPSGEYERLCADLRTMGARVDANCVEGAKVWSRTPSMDESSVPNAPIQAIVRWLAGTTQ